MELCICKISDFEDFAGLSLISEERQERLAHLRHREDKLRCLCAGLLLRYLLGDRAGYIIKNEYGKPYLPDDSLCFSLSHSGGYVLIAADSQELGADIQELRSVPTGISNRCLTDEERTWLSAQASEEAFYKLWTAKESVMKASGRGFGMPANSFSVLPVENGLHDVGSAKWNIQWYELSGYAICTAAKTSSRACIRFLSRQSLLSTQE